MLWADLNECELGDPCPGHRNNMTCHNTPGSFTCSCARGFRFNPRSRHCEGKQPNDTIRFNGTDDYRISADTEAVSCDSIDIRKTFIRRTGIIKSLKTEKNLAIIMHYISKTSRLRDVCICVISCFICYAPNCRTSITAHTILTKAIEVSLI